MAAVQKPKYEINIVGDSEIESVHHIGLSYDGNYYSVIFGKYMNGGFCSIPNWGIGCELSFDFKDVFWNEESLYKVLKRKGASNAIALAIAEFEDRNEQFSVNLPKTVPINTSEKLASVAGVSEKTYRMGAKILNSDNKEVKEKVLSGEMSINAGYNKIKETTKQKENINNEHTTTPLPSTQKETQKPKISEEVKQICEDLKTERSKEYLDSIWDYKIDIIECMNAGFDRFYDGFVSTLEDMENRVTKRELDECIANAENMVEKMLNAIEVAKNIILKTED